MVEGKVNPNMHVIGEFEMKAPKLLKKIKNNFFFDGSRLAKEN